MWSFGKELGGQEGRAKWGELSPKDRGKKVTRRRLHPRYCERRQRRVHRPQALARERDAVGAHEIRWQ